MYKLKDNIYYASKDIEKIYGLNRNDLYNFRDCYALKPDLVTKNSYCFYLKSKENHKLFTKLKVFKLLGIKPSDTTAMLKTNDNFFRNRIEERIKELNILLKEFEGVKYGKSKKYN